MQCFDVRRLIRPSFSHNSNGHSLSDRKTKTFETFIRVKPFLKWQYAKKFSRFYGTIYITLFFTSLTSKLSIENKQSDRTRLSMKVMHRQTLQFLPPIEPFIYSFIVKLILFVYAFLLQCSWPTEFFLVLTKLAFAAVI